MADDMKEKIKNMSPEELRKFQKEQCIFCHIISKKVQSRRIYEDDKCLAILDINPANPGHILLMPKEHYAVMPQIPEDIVGHIGMVSKQLSSSCLKAFKCSGTTVFAANGIVAGQKAQHFMIHIIPRIDEDGVGITIPENRMNEDDAEKIREAITKKVNEIFGLKPEPEKPKPVDLPQNIETPKKNVNEQRIIDIKQPKPEIKENVQNNDLNKNISPEKKKEKEDLDKIAGLFLR